MEANAEKPPVVVYWLRRDFRLFDNPALLAALSTGATVVRGRRAPRPPASKASDAPTRSPCTFERKAPHD